MEKDGRRRERPGALSFAVALLAAALPGCRVREPVRSVVVYASIDQVQAEPVLRAFEASSGIRVLPVYDVEAAKTTGLANRLIAERRRPQADVFWSGEIVQTLRLKAEGILAAYDSPSAADIPDRERDPERFWTGFAGRARVIIVNTKILPPDRRPGSLEDFLDDRWPAETVGIALPLFGTTATHAAAIYAFRGPDRARTFFKALKRRGVRILDGNSVVRDLVASGQLAFGLTDTDDACVALKRGLPVAMVFPDQGADRPGTLAIPTTVAMIAGAPHPAEGRAFVDHLLSPDVELRLVGSGWSSFPFRFPGQIRPCGIPESVRAMSVGYPEIFAAWDTAQKDMRDIFLR